MVGLDVGQCWDWRETRRRDAVTPPIRRIGGGVTGYPVNGSQIADVDVRQDIGDNEDIRRDRVGGLNCLWGGKGSEVDVCIPIPPVKVLDATGGVGDVDVVVEERKPTVLGHLPVQGSQRGAGEIHLLTGGRKVTPKRNRDATTINNIRRVERQITPITEGVIMALRIAKEK